VRGLEQLSGEASMIVGNHDGGYLAADALSFGSYYYERMGTRGRRLYTLMHDFPFRIAPGMAAWLERLGLLPASRLNARRVLDGGQHLVVFPGGAREAFRPFWERRNIELGQRTGFIRMALERRVPIVPMVSTGCHETLFVLSRAEALARLLRIPELFRVEVFPIWIGLPWGIGFGPIPHWPLPAKIRIQLLPPIELHRELGSSVHPDDSDARAAGLALVQKRMQAAADRMYDQRRFPLIG
jgi:1-acyl-sn-glycerol-3-phosphate acyltransferase